MVNLFYEWLTYGLMRFAVCVFRSMMLMQQHLREMALKMMMMIQSKGQMMIQVTMLVWRMMIQVTVIVRMMKMLL